MRNLNRRKQLDRTCEQRSCEQDNQQPGVGVEPSEFLFQGIQHLSELVQWINRSAVVAYPNIQ